jgi:hypothetical protein
VLQLIVEPAHPPNPVSEQSYRDKTEVVRIPIDMRRECAESMSQLGRWRLSCIRRLQQKSAAKALAHGVLKQLSPNEQISRRGLAAVGHPPSNDCAPPT